MDETELRRLLDAADESNKHRSKEKGQVRAIGIIPLHGPIFPKANIMTQMSGATSLEEWRSDFTELMNNDFIQTIVMDVDSPGGHADMVPETAAMIREARNHKDIIAVSNTAMDSAAYYLGSQATKIYASPSAQVGSIGTILTHIDDSGAMAMKGIKETHIHGGKYKAELSGPLTDEAKAHLQAYVDDHYRTFVQDVATGRGITPEEVEEKYGQGRVFSAQMGLDVGMIDGIASLDHVLGRLLESGGDIAALDTQPVAVAAGAERIVLGESYDADKEHSEPGTGAGGEPQPRTPPEEGDPAIKGGWRRDPPPAAYEDEEEVYVMGRERMEALATKLGIEFTADTSDEELSDAIDSQVDSVVVPLTTAAQAAQEELDWSTKFPEQAKQLAELQAESNINKARVFAESYSHFEDDPKKGFSTVVRDAIQEAHGKISARSFGHADLKELLDLTSKSTSVVSWGEEGSQRRDGDEGGATAATGDFVADRKAFAELVRTAMTQDGMTQKAAIAHVSQTHPELAKSYAVGHVGRG